MIRGLSRPVVGLFGLVGFAACGGGDDTTAETSTTETKSSISTVAASGDTSPSSSVSLSTAVTTGANATSAPLVEPASSSSQTTIAGGNSGSVDLSTWDGGTQAAIVFASTINFQLEDRMDAALAAPGDIGGRLGPGPFQRATEEFVHDMNDLLKIFPAPPEIQAVIDKFFADLAPLDEISHAQPISRDAQAWEAALTKAASAAHDYYDTMGFEAQGFAEPPPFKNP